MPSIVFKEWLPDQPELGNGGLIRAQNVLPCDDGFAPYRGLDTSGPTVGSAALIIDAFMSSGVTKGATRVYSYTGDFFIGSTSAGGAFTTPASIVDFAQYENIVIAVGDTFDARKQTVGSASNFSTLAATGTAPPAQAVGVIGQFVVIGNLGTANATQYPNIIQWSGADAPTSWPTPGSATAIAQQAGEQALPSLGGEVYAIHGGDQHGLVLQKEMITRMTYVGPPVVFQFDTLSSTEGCFFQRGHLRVGGVSYFVSRQGFCRTDGVTIDHIGAGKVDREFWSTVNVGGSNPVQIGYDYKNDLVYFGYSVTSAASMDRIMIFNPKNGAWSQAVQTMTAFVTGSPSLTTSFPMTGFSTAGGQALTGRFMATAGAAVFETGEFEINEGGRTYLDAVKPHVESSATAPALGVRIGYRNSLDTTPSYTSTSGALARTGFANFRNDAKYQRIELNITGNFEKATGLEFNAKPSGVA